MLKCCCFEFGKITDFFRVYVRIDSRGSKYGFVVFYREFTKLATGVSFFVLVASAIATAGPRGAVPPERLLLPPLHFGLLRMLFGASRNKTTGNNGKGIIIFKHNSRLKVSRLFAKLLATNCFT